MHAAHCWTDLSPQERAVAGGIAVILWMLIGALAAGLGAWATQG